MTPQALPSFKKVGRKVIYRGRVIELVQDTLLVQGRRLTREVVLHPGAVAIVPFIDAKHILFVRQYRHAVGRMLLELPAGTLSPNEPRLACAKRELEEETGYRAGKWTKLSQFYAAPGCVSEQMTIFRADHLTLTGAHPEEDEFLSLVTLSVREAFAHIRSGAICDAKTIIGVLSAMG